MLVNKGFVSNFLKLILRFCERFTENFEVIREKSSLINISIISDKNIWLYEQLAKAPSFKKQ